MQEIRRRAAQVKRGDVGRRIRDAWHSLRPPPGPGTCWTGGILGPERSIELSSVDLHALRREGLDDVLRRMEGISVLLLPGVSRFPRAFAVREAHAPLVRGRLAAMLPSWSIGGATGGLTLRPLYAQAGNALESGRDLEIQVHVLREEGQDWVGLTKDAPSRIPALAWDELCAESLVTNLDDTSITQPSPIDAVLTWVDGDDPRWQSRRDAAIADSSGSLHSTSTDPARFEQVDELRYALRSIHQYAGWIRTIHLVTDAQVPTWLDVDHPRIHLVDHQELLGGSRFNSHAIESALHRIPGLAEHYLYLNDDVMLGRIAYPGDFFAAPGVSRFFPSDLPIDPGPATERDLPLMAAAKNGRDLLERRFGVRVTSRLRHTVHPQQRSIGEQIERENPERVAATRAAAFRSPQDLSLASSLHHWYAMAQGRAASHEPEYLYVDLSDPQVGQTLDALGSLRRYDSFCLNRERSGPQDARALREMSRFLDKYFPTGAPWEKQEMSVTREDAAGGTMRRTV